MVRRWFSRSSCSEIDEVRRKLRGSRFGEENKNKNELKKKQVRDESGKWCSFVFPNRAMEAGRHFSQKCCSTVNIVHSVIE